MTGRTMDVRGARIRVLEAGPSDGDPVLLIHGVGGWAENWRETMAALAGRGYRACAVDLPGFGESESPRRARYFDPERPFYARFVVDLLDALGWQRAHIVGHSLGGAVAYTAAVTAPQRTSSLTLVAGGGLGVEVALALRLATLPGMRLVAWLRGPRATRDGVASCFYDVRRVPQSVWEEADRFVPRSLGETIRVLRAGVTIRGVRPGLRSSWLARADRYRGPVLVVWGERDAVLPVAQAHAVAEAFPHAEVRLVPDAGHLVMIEQPELFQAALMPFLQRAESTRISA
jgi:pimeloyl-ACP methyl ester carboxylesterase